MRLKDFEINISTIFAIALILALFLYIIARNYVAEVEQTVDSLRDHEIFPKSATSMDFVVFIVGVSTLILAILLPPLYFFDKIKFETKQEHSLDAIKKENKKHAKRKKLT